MNGNLKFFQLKKKNARKKWLRFVYNDMINNINVSHSICYSNTLIAYALVLRKFVALIQTISNFRGQMTIQTCRFIATIDILKSIFSLPIENYFANFSFNKEHSKVYCYKSIDELYPLNMLQAKLFYYILTIFYYYKTSKMEKDCSIDNLNYHIIWANINGITHYHFVDWPVGYLNII